MALSHREGVEAFHITFLAELGTKLEKSRYAVKGGCNLRLFFKSPRYSEDLDLDVGGVPVETLRSNVKRVLDGRAIRLSLAAIGIEMTSISTPKQTETTQRWKLGLRVGNVDTHTKLEFSRRKLGEGREVGRVDPALVARYGLSPVLVSHYGRAAALEQKCRALAGRSETQARDVFDLDLLLQGAALPPGIPKATRLAAVEKAQSLDFATFRAQVVAYLPASQQALYETSVWDDMQLRLLAALRGEA